MLGVRVCVRVYCWGLGILLWLGLGLMVMVR